MGIIIDVLILLFFVLFIRKNYLKQQLRCTLETISTVLATIFSVPLSIMTAELIYTKIFRNALAHNIERVITNTSTAESQTSLIARVMHQMPSVINNAASSYQVTTAKNITEVERLFLSGQATAADDIVDIIARPIIEGIFRAVLCFVFFYMLSYLISSLAAVFENALYTPERAVQNGVLCGVFGCIKALAVFSVIVAMIQLMLPALPHIPILNAETLSKSFLFRLFYHQNILMLFLGKGIYPTVL